MASRLLHPPAQGGDFQDHGAQAGRTYLPGLFQDHLGGDVNAVDLAQEAHKDILAAAGAMVPGETLAYRASVPPGRVWELLHIDNFWAIATVPRSPSLREADPALARLCSITAAARAGYAAAGLERAPDKSSDEVEMVTIISTEVEAETGIVGAPLVKRQHIAMLCVWAASLSVGTKGGPSCIRSVIVASQCRRSIRPTVGWTLCRAVGWRTCPRTWLTNLSLAPR